MFQMMLVLLILESYFNSPRSRVNKSMCFVRLLTHQILTSSSQHFFFFRVDENAPYLLEDPILGAVAEKHKKTPALISLRYLLQRGIVVIAKSFNEKRIKENMKVQKRLWASGLLRSVSPLKACLQASSILVSGNCAWHSVGICVSSVCMSIFFSTIALWIHGCGGLKLTLFPL